MKIFFTTFTFAILGCYLQIFSWAGPPLDVVVPQATPMPKSKLNENDLVYTSNLSNQKVTGDLKTTVSIKKVVGRSLPGRTGKELAVLTKGDSVGLLQFSKDGAWRAVYSFKHSLKVWVPEKSLVPLPVKKEPPPAAIPKVEIPPGRSE